MREPRASGLAAHWVPTTGLIDDRQVAGAVAIDTVERGGEVLFGRAVQAIRRIDGGIALETSAGRIAARRVIACVGLQATAAFAIAVRIPHDATEGIGHRGSVRP